MTAKPKVGKTFRGITRYAMQECKEAKVLAASGVRFDTAEHMADDFEFKRSQRPGLGNAVLHVAISLHADEGIGRTREQVGELLKQSAAAWRKEMGIEDTQWSLTQHFDRKHPHAHLLINRVDKAGNVISDSFIGQRSRKAAQEVEHQLGLKSAEERGREYAKQPEPTPSQLKARTPKEIRQADWQRTRHEMANALLPHKGKCGSFEDLQSKVVWDCIEVKSLTRNTVAGPVIYGVTFTKNGFTVKGSDVGKEFGAGNLQKSFTAYNEQVAAQTAAIQDLTMAFNAQALGQLFADGAKQAQVAATPSPTRQVLQTPKPLDRGNEIGI